MSYYSDLSADSSSDEEEEEEDDFSDKDVVQNFIPPSNSRHGNTTTTSSSFTKIILHLDIDCFYCQCEHLDRQLPASRPLAIGQKHIIVTSNYAARQMGVQKLQLRQDATKACPSLLIVEGSDLERYRQHGRKVYEAFRACLQNKIELGQPAAAVAAAVKRGRGMDEMQADVTALVDALYATNDSMTLVEGDKIKSSVPIYVYGDNNETATLTEDQTGAQAIVQPYDKSNDNHHHHHHHHHHQYGQNFACHTNSSLTSREMCQQRLLLAAQRLGWIVQQFILKQTGFTTTVGISTNPLLAKIASDLQKPNSINVLYPWRAPSLVASMPLRKIPDAGYRTLQLLKPVLERYHGVVREGKQSFWTCGDLLRLPRSEIEMCLENQDQCNMLLERCRGIDTTIIVDDQGMAPKTISVENSFMRGTVTTAPDVWKGLDELYVRLPRLLKDRQQWSQHPDKAYPTTIKLTARVVDPTLVTKRRRPFVTKSKQVPFLRGKELLDERNPERQAAMIREAVRPLVVSLVLNNNVNNNSNNLNVTRLNIATTNFCDVTMDTVEPTISINKFPGTKKNQQRQQQQLSMAMYSSQGNRLSQSQASHHLSSNIGRKDNNDSRQTFSIIKEQQSKRSRPTTNLSQTTLSLKPTHKKQRQEPSTTTNLSHSKSSDATFGFSLPSGIDPAALAELPAEMIQEVVRDYNNVMRSGNSSSKTTAAKSKESKPMRIDQFFSRR